MENYIRCLAESLDDFEVEEAVKRCAGLLDRSVLFSIAGEKALMGGAGEAVLPLLEAFLGGVDLRLLTVEKAEKIRDYLLERLEGLSGRRRSAAELAAYIASEALERIKAGISPPEPPQPLLPTTPLGLALLHGFFWPLHVEVDPTEHVKRLVDGILEQAGRGGAPIAGKPGSGRTALLYLVASKAAEEGRRVVLGEPQEWMSPDSILVVSPGPRSSTVPTVWVASGGDAIFDEEYLSRLAEAILGFDGVDYGSAAVARLVERSGGSPVYVEAASLLLRLRNSHATPSSIDELPGSAEELVREAASLLGPVDTPGLPLFPGDAAGPSLKRLAERGVLLEYGEAGVYGYRNSLWPRHAGGRLEVGAALASTAPWWAAAALALHGGAGGELVDAALESMAGRGPLVLDVAAALSPGSVYSRLYPYTSYRVELLGNKAVEAGAYTAAALLYRLASDQLLGLEGFTERRAALLVKWGEAEIERMMPDAALEAFRRAVELGATGYRAAALIDMGVALAALGRGGEAEEKLREGLEALEGRPDSLAAKAYTTLGVLAEERGDGERAVEMYKRAIDVLAQLVYRGDCSVAGELYRVAERLKKVRGRGDPRVCGGLAKCGLFELYTRYGC